MEQGQERWAVVGVVDPDAYAAAAYETAAIDMLKYSEIMAIFVAGDIVSTGTIDGGVYYDTATGGSYTSAVTGATITQLTQAGTDSNKQVVVRVSAAEVAAMTEGARFVKVKATLGTAGADFGLIVLGRVVYSPASAYDLAAVDEIVN